MIWFVRYIDRLAMCVSIELSLYYEYEKIFLHVFRAYNLDTICHKTISKENVIHIVKNKVEDLNCYVCNTSKYDWIQDLINFIEDWQAAILNCTVFHGSALLINGKGVLVLGNRKKGKTTLTGYLSIIENNPYLDDDCIYYYNGKYIGFNMPISLRNNVDNLPNKFLLGKTLDIDNIQRQLFISPNAVCEINDIKFIIFPNYDGNCIAEIKMIKDYNLIINLLIRNTRQHENVKKVCNDILNLARNAKTFEMKYSNSKAACSMLYSIIDSL